jgi:xanthine dehydrogenase YagT iron-sulfur-binding subunit
VSKLKDDLDELPPIPEDLGAPENGSRGLNVSRRGFIRGLGTGLAGTAIAGAGALADEREAEAQGAVPAAPRGPGRMGPDPVRMTLNINGRDQAVEVEPRVTLASVLRNRLDLTGTKVVCDRGSCGACTVHIDGKSVYSCMMLAADAVGKKITTIEGLAKGDDLHPVQEAFMRHDALMCGYCTPGFIMASSAYLKNKAPARPTREQVQAGISGNLCRCGTYHGIIEAVQAAAPKVKGA